MPEPITPEPITPEPFMAVGRITQKLVTQHLRAALEQLDLITGTIRQDEAATNLGVLYVNAVNARTHLEAVLKELPWAQLPLDGRPRTVGSPPPPPLPPG